LAVTGLAGAYGNIRVPSLSRGPRQHGTQRTELGGKLRKPVSERWKFYCRSYRGFYVGKDDRPKDRRKLFKQIRIQSNPIMNPDVKVDFPLCYTGNTEKLTWRASTEGNLSIKYTFAAFVSGHF
jgi:hypothetical protein